MSEQVHLLHVPQLGQTPGFAHLAEVRGERTVFLSGQIATNAAGEVVGVSDISEQTRQVFRNIGTALSAVGLSYADLIKLTIFLTDINDVSAFRSVRDEFVNVQNPPASSLVQVAGLVRPELLIEIAAIAAAS